ncbi:MAG: MOSC domain-containing protein [Myxococcota bacterium]
MDPHLDLATLTARYAALPPAPRDRGTLSLLVARPDSDQRQTLERARLSREGGVPGDRWQEKDGRPESQLAVMRTDVATLMANGRPLTLFGDNLFVDLDLSSENLPTGSRVRIGECLLEVTPEPHNGCAKFEQRFGGDALRFTARKETRDQHFRGIYLTVIEEGDVRVGDPVEVVSRA